MAEAEVRDAVAAPDASVRVLLVDDHDLVRAGFRALLDLEPGFEVVGEARDGAEAVRLAELLAPDVVCMDVQMPVRDGIEATRDLVAADSVHARIIVLTTFRDDAVVQAALRAGASGFVLKNSPPAVLVDSIRTVHQGDALIDPQVTMSVIAAMRSGESASAWTGIAPSDPPVPSAPPVPPASQAPAPEPVELARLTARERDVLDGVARGLSNTAIASHLFVSEATVKTHVSNLLAKLGVRDRIHAVIFAYEHGVVSHHR